MAQSGIVIHLETDLIKRAAQRWGVEADPESNKKFYTEISKWSRLVECKSVYTFPLTPELLKFLSEKDFSFGRIDPNAQIHPQEDLVFLYPNQEINDLLGDGGWAFKASQETPFVEIGYLMEVVKNEPGAGIKCIPRIQGMHHSENLIPPTVNKLVNALTEFALMRGDAHPLMVAMLRTNQILLISFEEIGLDGIAPVYKLFYQHYKGKTNIMRLGGNRLSPFDPEPEVACAYEDGSRAIDRYFVAKDSQKALTDLWDVQLEKFRESLR